MAEAPLARGILRQSAPPRAIRNSWSDAARSALLGPRQPLDEQDVEAFFVRDAATRLGRLVETGIAMSLFLFCIYLGTVRPVASWTILHEPVFWIVAFLPLLALDVRGVQFTVYLRRNKMRFSELEWVQHLITALSEFLSKVALCAYVVSPEEQRLPLKIIMLPYMLGYVLHFVLGYCVQQEEDLVRPEGCNSVTWLIAEFLRLFFFVLVIMVAAKVDDPLHLYSWQTAFCPAWAIVGLAALVALALLPMCILAVRRQSPKAVILCWVVPMCGIFATVVSLLLRDIGYVLSYCSWPSDGTPVSLVGCDARLTQGLLPLAVFLAVFGIYTACLRSRLTVALHAMWYHAPVQEESGEPTVEVLPTPEIMFRITPTYYTRNFIPEDSWELSNLGSVLSHSASRAPSASGSFVRQTTPSRHGSQIGAGPSRGRAVSAPSAPGSSAREATRSTTSGPWRFLRGASGSKAPNNGSWGKNGDSHAGSARSASGADGGFAGAGWGASTVSVDPNTTMSVDGSFVSVGGTKHHRDHAASVLSAQGSVYSEIVEDENLCFVCYADVPDGILLECGHAGMCVECAVRMMERESSSCPICRTVISQVLRLRDDKPPQCLFGNDRLDSRGSSRGGIRRSSSGSFRRPPTTLKPARRSEPLADLEAVSIKSLSTPVSDDDEPDAPASLVPPLPAYAELSDPSSQQLPSDSWGDQLIADNLPGHGSWGSNGAMLRYPAAAQRTAFLVEGVRVWTRPTR